MKMLNVFSGIVFRLEVSKWWASDGKFATMRSSLNNECVVRLISKQNVKWFFELVRLHVHNSAFWIRFHHIDAGLIDRYVDYDYLNWMKIVYLKK